MYKVVDDRYELIEPLGPERPGGPWRARDRRLDRLVAVKRSVVGSDPSVDRALSEARAAAGLSHPNLVSVYDVGQDDASPYLVMELVDEPGIHELAATLSPRRIIEAGAQVADGLAAAHQAGVVHRRVEPSAIRMTERGAVLVDLGAGDAEADPLGALVAAPEVRNGGPATPASDVHSLAATLHLLLRPHRSSPGAIPLAVDQVLDRARSTDPSARPSARDLGDQLRSGLEMITDHTAVMALGDAPTTRIALPSDGADGLPAEADPRPASSAPLAGESARETARESLRETIRPGLVVVALLVIALAAGLLVNAARLTWLSDGGGVPGIGLGGSSVDAADSASVLEVAAPSTSSVSTESPSAESSSADSSSAGSSSTTTVSTTTGPKRASDVLDDALAAVDDRNDKTSERFGRLGERADRAAEALADGQTREAERQLAKARREARRWFRGDTRSVALDAIDQVADGLGLDASADGDWWDDDD